MAMLHVLFSNTTPTLVSPTACTATYPPTFGAGHTMTLCCVSQVFPASRLKMADTLVRAATLWLPACTSRLLLVVVPTVAMLATVFLQPGSGSAPTSLSLEAIQCKPPSVLRAAPTQCAADGSVQCVPAGVWTQTGFEQLYTRIRRGRN